MVIDFYDIKGNYLTDIDISESDVKVLCRYAILKIINEQDKQKKKNPFKLNKK